VNIWWFPAAIGGLFLIAGFVQARFPRQSLDYLDSRGIPVHGVPRTVGGIRAMGIIFVVAGAAAVLVGLLALFGAIDYPQ
jgi:uncharacterized membrane protein YphA (DoxX/SURF4 family)